MSKLDQTCLNWIRFVQIGLNFSKNGSNFSKMDQTCLNCNKLMGGSITSKLDQIYQNWIKLVKDISNLFQLDQNVKICQKSCLLIWKEEKDVNFSAPMKTEKVFSFVQSYIHYT